MQKPSLTIRKWIRWSDGPYEEPTSTLVLTAPSGLFVDVRLKRQGEVDTHKPLDGNELRVLSQRRLPMNDGAPSEFELVEMASAGQSTRIVEAEGQKTRGTWSHWVDSMHEVPQCDEIVDTGIMQEAPDPTSGALVEIESGAMLNTLTGKVEQYDEVWADLPVKAANFPWVVLRTLPDDEQLMKDEKSGTIRGVVIRIGPWCQGIMRVGLKVICERWLLQPEDTTGDTSATLAWTLVARVGNLTHQSLPCNASFTPEGLIKGHILENSGVEWQVEEIGRSAT